MSGLSYKAAGKLENKKSKFNGYELNDDFNLNVYESFYRVHDPQLGGRFWQIDPSPNFDESPYAAMGNNPIRNTDRLGDTLDFPGASETFINQVFDAITYLNDNGVGDNMLKLMQSPVHFSMYEQTDEDGTDGSSSDAPVIVWSPTNGLLVSNGVVLSPATNLDHEADHQLQRIKHPEQYKQDIKPGSDKQYDNKEDRRVITGREQKVARALGEIKKGRVTRRNHQGLNVTTPGPTSNKYEKISKQKEKEILDRIKKQIEQGHKPIHSGGAGPADKPMKDKIKNEE